MKDWTAGRVAGCTLALVIAATFLVKAQTSKPSTLDRTAAAATFEHIKKLSGTWQSTSSKGWEERQQFRIIANGAVVVSQSAQVSGQAAKGASAPNSPMMTVFHMDGDRLLLTHYCEAGNQPRLAATSLEDSGRTVRFTFLDATGLASPNAGHMHSVVLTFVDDNHYTDQWSWYQGGKEEWMETVQNERVASAKP